MRKHVRFLVAFGFGMALWLAAQASPLDLAMRVLVGVNGFFVTYLALMLHLSLVTTVDNLRRHAEADDEGSFLILFLAVGAAAISLGSIFLVMSQVKGNIAEATFALAAAPLGWAMLHVLAAYRYAHLYYAPDPDSGLDFPGSAPPGVWDFLYFSFTIGMTAQVSDIEVTTAEMRKVVLLHSVGAFFYNTVILALSVNAALQMSQ